VDYCRAVASAIFGDPGRVHFVPTTAQDRLKAIESGVVDILSRNTTWTLSRDASLPLDFVATNFYDGQGFMVPAGSRVRAARELGGASICVEPGTTTEQNLTDWARATGTRITPVVIDGLAASVSAYLARRCDAYTTDISALSAIRAAQPNPADHVILPNVISKEPLAIVVRQDDQRFSNLVRWTHYLLVAAEAANITQANVQQSRQGDARPDVQRMLGRSGGLGPMLGLTDHWAVDVIGAVGNYGEIFARNLEPVGIQRGPNALWTTPGGLQYAPPFR
jgi:general L-amino acid transport system substrate-binding protein